MTSQTDAPRYVSQDEIEAQWAALGGLPGAPALGLFGPGSVTWRLNRESAVFLGAGRAALLQLAHPWVSAALMQHSNLRNDAIGRFHSTFRVIYTMLFGSRAQAFRAARQVYSLHTGIRGELSGTVGARPAGEHYEANEAGALTWVYATLVESAVLAYEFAVQPLTAPDREQYYAESKRVAALFGVSAAALPGDWSSFARYTAEMVESPALGVDASACALGRSVMDGAGSWVHPPGWYRALTASWMPTRFRTSFALAYGVHEERAVGEAARWLPRVYACLPRGLRLVGPFHEAEARLRGEEPGLLTRRSNRFWMGVPRMLYPQPAAGLGGEGSA